MKYNFIKSVALFALFAGTMSSCITDDDYSTPDLTCVEPGFTANKTVASVNAMANGTIQQYTQDDVIEAYVTSSDERGTFFKSISLQTLPADGPVIGFSIQVDATSLFGEGFYPGRKIYIKLNELSYSKVDGSLRFGIPYQSSPTSAITVGRIPQTQYRNHVVPSCSEVSEDALVRTMTIAQAKTDANLNTLIELDNVQFVDENVGKPYFAENDPSTIGGATNRTLMDAQGGQTIFRTSSFANFAGNKISGNSGKVRGVMTKFGTDYQFLVRYESDIMLDQPRFDPAPPLVGNALTYGLYNQNFETTAVGTRNFPNAINDAFVGARYWEVKTFGGNEYIEMTSFAGSGNPGVVARSLFFVPVDFTAANTFTFKKEFRFMAGEALKVYYVTAANYTPGSTPNMANFVDITAQFTNLIYPANGQSQNSFTTAGTYNIPATLTGNGFFVFEYSGNQTVTTTVQIDDIVVN